MSKAKIERGDPLVILHVEDDPAHAELVRRGFEAHRIANEIRHVATADAALDYLFRRASYSDPQSSPRPDVILLDLRLPGADGLTVLARIRGSSELESLPVVVLTSSEADRDRIESYEHRIDGYIVKPLGFESFAVLLDVISMVLPDED